jgi:hypothetical protein
VPDLTGQKIAVSARHGLFLRGVNDRACPRTIRRFENSGNVEVPSNRFPKSGNDLRSEAIELLERLERAGVIIERSG